MLEDCVANDITVLWGDCNKALEMGGLPAVMAIRGSDSSRAARSISYDQNRSTRGNVFQKNFKKIL